MSKAKTPTAKKPKEAASKSTVRHPVSHPDTEKLSTLHKHIQERIADGGATTDHLKHMLTMIKPAEPAPGAPADETQNLSR